MKACSKCGVEKENSSFMLVKKTGKLTAHCRSCQADMVRAWEARNPDRIKARGKAYRLRNPEKSKESCRQWRQKNPGKQSELTKEWMRRNPDWRQRNTKTRRDRIKDEVFMAYGGYECACCGETEPMFLTIDHIDNDGAEHRRAMKSTGGSSFFAWLRTNGFPKGFQVLCRNCNWGKHANGGICPHMNSEGSETIPTGSTSQAGRKCGAT